MLLLSRLARIAPNSARPASLAERRLEGVQGQRRNIALLTRKRLDGLTRFLNRERGRAGEAEGVRLLFVQVEPSSPARVLAVLVPLADVRHPGSPGDRGQEVVGDVARVLTALVG